MTSPEGWKHLTNTKFFFKINKAHFIIKKTKTLGGPVTCPELYGCHQTNSVKINGKYNWSKKLKSDKLPQTEQLKTMGRKTRLYLGFLDRKTTSAGRNGTWTYLVCSRDSTVPSPPGLGWPLGMAGKPADSK